MKALLSKTEPLRDATLKQMRSLAALLQHGSISAAAKHLHLTPPAVGQQLKLLERSVGVPLTTRTPSGLRATDAGREVLVTAANIEAELESCRRLLTGIVGGSGGSVTLGAVSTAKYFAPQLLASFWHDHPGIQVTLSVGNRHETITALGGADVDMAIMGRPPEDLDLDTEVIGSHPHVVISAPEHVLAGERRVTLRRLCDERVVVREQGSGTRILNDALFARSTHQPRTAMEASSNETIKQAVIAGLGVALISAHTVATELADQRLVALHVEGTPIMRRWYAVRRRKAHSSPASDALWLFLTEHAERHLPAVDVNRRQPR